MLGENTEVMNVNATLRPLEPLSLNTSTINTSAFPIDVCSVFVSPVNEPSGFTRL